MSIFFITHSDTGDGPGRQKACEIDYMKIFSWECTTYSSPLFFSWRISKSIAISWKILAKYCKTANDTMQDIIANSALKVSRYFILLVIIGMSYTIGKFLTSPFQWHYLIRHAILSARCFTENATSGPLYTTNKPLMIICSYNCIQNEKGWFYCHSHFTELLISYQLNEQIVPANTSWCSALMDLDLCWRSTMLTWSK